MIDYYQTLFDPEDMVCLGKTKFDIEARPLQYVEATEQFICINALVGTRKDENVVKYRNILLEFDKISLPDQLDALTDIPHSAITYSGGKSFHAIISLATPLESEALYRRVVRTLYKKLAYLEPDTSNGNPSRFSRTPGATRDNGKVQRLVKVKGRIPNNEFLQWLGPLEPEFEKREPILPGSRLLPVSVHSFLKYGVDENRNNAVFKNAIRMFEAGYDYDEIVSLCSNAVDLPIREIRTAVKSAQKKAEK